MTERYRIRL